MIPEPYVLPLLTRDRLRIANFIPTVASGFECNTDWLAAFLSEHHKAPLSDPQQNSAVLTANFP